MTAGTLGDLIRTACRWKGDAEMLVDPSLRLSGRESWAAIRAIAGELARRGIGRGDIVAFLCGPSARHAVVWFGCLLAGAVPCALHQRSTAQERETALAFLDPALAVTDSDRTGLKGTAGMVLSLEALLDAKPAAEEADWPGMTADPDDLALLLLSSGTTGAPKAIRHTHRTLIATAMAGPTIYGPLGPNDRVIAVMAPSFAAWTFTVLPSFAARATIVFDGWSGPEAFLERIAAERITMVALVPTLWRMLLAAPGMEEAAATVRAAFYSGEPGSADLVEGIATRFGASVHTAYLASEIANASGIVADGSLLALPGKSGSTGRPVPGADVRIVDPEQPTLVDLPQGETGEMAISGLSLSPGYWRDEARTAKAFSDGWWRSGDLGRIDADGLVHVTGRLDNRINTGGIKVNAEEVERALLAHPGVSFAAVVGEPDPQWGERIVAHVVAGGEQPTPEALIAYLRDNDLLPTNKIPKTIRFHDALPTGPTGKVLRRKLREEPIEKGSP